MLELRHISKGFEGLLALDDVSLSLDRGERLALVGENGAGKSSLMNVLYGLYQPDSGGVYVDGLLVAMRTPADALARGIGMVHQHFTLVPRLTVAENVVLGREPRRGWRFDFERAVREVGETCGRFAFDLDARARVDTLTVGSQQKVEIVKALHRGATTLILDEPTAVLTRQEGDELFAVTKRLSEQGLSVVLISHKLKEVFGVATRIAVLRRGRLVAQTTPSESDAESLAALMVGASSSPLPGTPDGSTEEAAGEAPRTVAAAEPRCVPDAPAALRVTHLGAAPKLRDVSLVVQVGEIVGVAGVDGNGQRELAEVLTGLRAATGGSFALFGEPASHLGPADLRARGVAHVPEDRHRRAVVEAMSVEENISLGAHRRAPFARRWLIDRPGRHAQACRLLQEHDVRPPDPYARLGTLSGGNQQKLVVGRELAQSPKVLVAVQPTRGLDLAAVRAVRARIQRASAGGCGVLLVSLDLDEVLELADRVVTIFEGRLTGEFRRGDYDERALGRRMLGLRDA